MLESTLAMSRQLTLRCLLALVIVGGLALANYLLLRGEIHANEVSLELLSLSGHQRTLLQSSGLLAHDLVTEDDAEKRGGLQEELLDTAEELEKAHFRLVKFDPLDAGKPLPEVQNIYENAPWLLDTEVRNYLTHLRQLARDEDAELTLVNPLYRYIRDVGRGRQIIDGLNEVVVLYQLASQQRAVRLRQMARWTLGSTWVVLGFTGLFVFRPMVREVKQNVGELRRLNETLEVRVAERTAVAEQRARKLADSEALYQSLVESLPMAVVRRDLRGRVSYVNRLYSELTGRPRSEAIGSKAPAFSTPQALLRGRRDDEQVLRDRQVLTRILQYESANGQTVYLESLKAPVTDASGAVTGVQTVYWDVSERKASEDRLLRAERLAAVGEMVAGVAHESRNALQQIGACAKMLQWELEDKPEALEMISDVLQAHNRLHRLFENLRGYVSPIKLQRRNVWLADELEKAWKSLDSQVGAAEAELIQQGDCSDLACWVDPFTIEQVFRNLLENSLAATPPPLRVTVRWQSGSVKGNPAVQLTLSDNGPGLPPAVIGRLFEPFFTTKTQGTGLGMVIVKRIVEAHGGTIRPLDPPNQHDEGRPGAHFEILLPRGDT